MKNLKYKRGVAIETALIVMFALVGFSILLTNITLLATNNKNQRLSNLTEKILVDSIGEDFVSHLTSGENAENFSSNVDGYRATASALNENGESFYTLKVIKCSKIALSAKLIKVGDNYKILEWKYS